jgi:hypothetical protein
MSPRLPVGTASDNRVQSACRRQPARGPVLYACLLCAVQIGLATEGSICTPGGLRLERDRGVYSRLPGDGQSCPPWG